MEITVLEHAGGEAVGKTYDVSLNLDDLSLLKAQAQRSFEIEQSLPSEARTPLGSVDELAYTNDFYKTRATNDALESLGIVPLVRPHVSVSGLSSGSLYSCEVSVIPRPNIGLTSLDPVDLKTNRIPKPGFSLQAAREGSTDVDFLDDEKTLRIALTKRLDSEFTEDEMRALSDEYQDEFENELAKRGMNPEVFRESHGLDEEQYAIMMTRRALEKAHWDYALDAVFDGCGFALCDDDVLAVLEESYPGYSAQLFELYELRNETYKWAGKARRAKALNWLRENTLR